MKYNNELNTDIYRVSCFISISYVTSIAMSSTVHDSNMQIRSVYYIPTEWSSYNIKQS